MGQTPYSSYHGRKRLGRSILVGVVAALFVVLAAVLAGYYLGLFNVPVTPNQTVTQVPPVPAQSAAPATPVGEDPAVPSPAEDPSVVIETPSPSPSPTPAAADLSAYLPRDIALGLVLVTPETLPEASKNGVLVDLSGVAPESLDAAFPAKLAALPYAAAWTDDAGQAAALAGLGFDELVLTATVPADDGAALAALYRQVKRELTAAGWKGRLALDVDQSLFESRYDDDLVPAVAQSFDRLYFRKTLTAKNKRALTDAGFTANGKTLVTAVRGPADLNYAWAVLPQKD